MHWSNEYTARAAELWAKARSSENRELAAEFVRLAEVYNRLADQADRNAMTDLVYEPPPPKLNDPH